MAKRKTKEVYEKEIVEVIRKNDDILFKEHIFLFYNDLAKAQFYNLELDESDAIKGALDANRTKAKQKMLNNWRESENSTLNIAAYRLIATDDERRKLNQQYIEATGKNGTPLMAREVAPTEARKIIDSLKNESMTE